MAQQTITRESFEHIDGKLNGTLSATEKKFLRDNASIANTKVLEDDFGVKDIAKNAKEGKPIDQEKRAVLQTYLFAKGAYKNIPNNT
ncbi:MAG: hypothetical protein LBG52_05400 [Candidatus Peribacteria bacterium]|jgi:hypothetical protein|nr:hypothetical protein [Candidatus Peribacteria bacterium]